MPRDIEAHRPRLRALAYRMLGSRSEAEDVVQDAWLRWQAADQAQVEDPLADALLSGEVRKGAEVTVTVRKGKIVFV